MNKKLMVMYLLAVSFSMNMLYAADVLSPQNSQIQMSSIKKTRKSGFVENSARMVHELVVKQVSTGVAAASSITMQAITAMAAGSSVSPFKALLSSVRMQEDMYHLSRDVVKVRLEHGSMLLVSRGATNSLTCLTLPEHRDKIICYHNQNTLVLGTQFQKWSKEAKNGEFDHRCATTVFRLTYAGAMPALEIQGQGFLQIVGDVGGDVASITLRDAATCVASGVRVGNLTFHQHGLSKMTIDRLEVSNLDYTILGASSASISGLEASNHVSLSIARPPSMKGEVMPTLRLQGRAAHLRAVLGLNAVLDARECITEHVHVTTLRGFASATVNANESLVIDGKKTGGFIEYAGNPQSIANLSAVVLKRSPIPGFLSWLTGQAVAQVESYRPAQSPRHPASGSSEAADAQALMSLEVGAV